MRTKITISAFCAMLVLFAVIIMCPADEESVLNENRTPSPMPEATAENIFSGGFCADFESYLADSVGFRGKLIAISDKINRLKGFQNFGYVTKANADLGAGTAVDDKGLLIAEGKIMEVFKAKPEVRDNYLAMINYYADKLPKDINLYSMIIPTQIEFQAEKYSSLADSQKESIDYIYGNAAERVNCVDVYDILKEHSEEYIYFRTDHHWTALGAYYAYKAFSEASGTEAVDIKDFKENKAEGFLGYLYKQAQATELKNKPDTIYYYTNGENIKTQGRAWEDGRELSYESKVFIIPGYGEEVKYSIFMGGDHPFLDIPSKADNGRTIMVIKDSYANAFLPWLINNFERVVAVDPRSFEGNITDVISEYKVTDVLLMNYVFTTTFDDIITLEKGIYK